MNKHIVRRIIILLSVIATIIVNGLATGLPLNGRTTGEISDSFDVYFVPAGYVFSIWGLIYVGLIVYAIYQLLPAQAQNPDLQGISALFVISSLANIAWIFLWQYLLFPYTIIAMVVLLLCLTGIYLRLGIGRRKVSAGMRWFVHLPFSIYLGWITVATIANVTTLLDYWNWSGWGISPEMWTVIMLAVATVVGGLMSFSRGDVAYAAVLVWAFVGIALKHSDTLVVSAAAWTAVAVTVILLVIALWRRRRKRRRAVLLE